MVTGTKETSQVQRFLLMSLACWGLYLLAQVLSLPDLDLWRPDLLRVAVGILGCWCMWRARTSTRWPRWTALAATLLLAWFSYRELQLWLVAEANQYARSIKDLFVWHALSIQFRYSQGDWLHLITEAYSVVFMPASQVAALAFVARHWRARSNLSPQPTVFGGG